jgi:hypothetical protein
MGLAVTGSGERRLVRTYYRSLTPDGIVWCESSNPAEVRRRSEDKDCTFEKISFYEVTAGWEPWTA